MVDKRAARARQVMRNNITSLKVSKKRLEYVIELIKNQNKRQGEDIKEMRERISVLEKKLYIFTNTEECCDNCAKHGECPNEKDCIWCAQWKRKHKGGRKDAKET